MDTVPMPFFERPTTPTRDWVRSELTAIARQLDLADVRAVTTTLASAAQWDPEMDARRQGFALLLTQRLGAALEAAEGRGEVVLSVAGDRAAALAIGPLHYRATIERGSVDDQLVDAAVEALGAWRTPPAPTSGG